MDRVDNTVVLAVPGATDPGPADPLLWASPALAVAAIAPIAVNRWPITRGRSHAIAHAHRGGDHH